MFIVVCNTCTCMTVCIYVHVLLYVYVYVILYVYMYMYYSLIISLYHYTITSHYKHLCKLQLRIVIRRSSSLAIVLASICIINYIHV